MTNALVPVTGPQTQHQSVAHAGSMPAHDQSCGCSRGPNVEHGKWYGVRSYLHLFYEDCTGAGLADDVTESPVSRAHGGWPSLVWKVSLSAGMLLLLIGAAALATGYLVPPKLEGIGEEEFMVLDLQAMAYNHALVTCRLVGTVLCAGAGALGVVGVLACMLGRAARGGEEEEEQQLSPILRQSPLKKHSTIIVPPAAAGSPAVPFGASQIQNIQPKRDTQLPLLPPSTTTPTP
ncbi:neurensin-2 isoform X1 [Gopherus flavomarginatus]|uniref:neurensin-2 isoform X1 n=2 Tax=Gopherus flavomarginatus TaxID=286002 RepID=UPI0021CBA8EF|nr:neurensin-2 isoform X1 [Gopherus flavomarginatus]